MRLLDRFIHYLALGRILLANRRHGGGREGPRLPAEAVGKAVRAVGRVLLVDGEGLGVGMRVWIVRPPLAKPDVEIMIAVAVEPFAAVDDLQIEVDASGGHGRLDGGGEVGVGLRVPHHHVEREMRR